MKPVAGVGFDVSFTNMDETFDKMIAGNAVARLGAMVQWADETGRYIVHELEAQTPVRTGRLQGSMRYQRTLLGGMSLRMEWHSNVPYAPFVIHGTAPHDIYPKAARALHWGPAGGGTFAMHVHHPGTKPNPFPARTMERVRLGVIASYMDAYKKAVML
jgi:hypothetical protein